MAGNFVWYELITTDAPAAEDFYRHVIGWSANDAGMPNVRYTLFSADTIPVAGMMQLSPEMCEGAEARSGWLGYVGVDNVDASAEQAKGLGATVYREPTDIPSVGRFAVLADPQGAVFALFKGLNESPALPPMAPGRPGWHELHAVNGEKAFAFYSALFGWKKLDALDMGPTGTYQIFSDGTRPMGTGGIFNKMAHEPTPYWLYYVAVRDIDAALARINEKGGKIINGPREVPGGAWVIQAFDPQGAAFALVGARANA